LNKKIDIIKESDVDDEKEKGGDNKEKEEGNDDDEKENDDEDQENEEKGQSVILTTVLTFTFRTRFIY
jgi:hypothetical protein